MTNSLTLHPVNGEPRVHDLELAERLGFDRPVNVRNLIKRNSQKLEAFGPLFTVERVINGGKATEFYLNQRQSVFICMKSETAQAFEVQAEIVRVFDAWLTGTLEPRQIPTPLTRTGEALHLIADSLTDHGNRLDLHDVLLSTQQQKIQILENHIGTLATAIHRNRHRVPIVDTRQVALDLDPPANRRTPHQGGTHAAPRPHRRRAHYRTLSDGRRVEVRAAQIGIRNKDGETLQ